MIYFFLIVFLLAGFGIMLAGIVAMTDGSLGFAIVAFVLGAALVFGGVVNYRHMRAEQCHDRGGTMVKNDHLTFTGKVWVRGSHCQVIERMP